VFEQGPISATFFSVEQASEAGEGRVYVCQNKRKYLLGPGQHAKKSGEIVQEFE
jgi:hypothetical protein